MTQWLTVFICIVAYALGIYLLNMFLAFLSPKFDPSNDAIDSEMEDGSAGGLPTKQDEEFRPFIRRLPEFKFWHGATRAIGIGFLCTWFEVFNVPVFWPVLVMYWIILFVLTSKTSGNNPPPPKKSIKKHQKVPNGSPQKLTWIINSAQADPAHDQVQVRTVLLRQDQIQQQIDEGGKGGK